MMKVFKYPVPKGGDEFEIELPMGAQILEVAAQGNQGLQLWALVNEAAIKEVRRFRIAGTGHSLDYKSNELQHITTFQTVNGIFVFHVFEIRQ